MNRLKFENMATWVNSAEYWEQRFIKDWDKNQGVAQSIFFMNLAIKLLPEWLKNILDSGGKSICDWGCAEGDGTQILSKSFPKNYVKGIDFSETAIKTANSRYKSKNLKFKAIDLLKAKYNSNFDIVFCSNTFEHFSDPWSVFKKIGSYASEMFIMLVPYNEDPKNMVSEHFYRFTNKDFILNNGEWAVVHFEVIDASKLPRSQWSGQQAIIIFVRNNILPKFNLTLNQINLTSDLNIKLTELKESKKQLKRTIKTQNVKLTKYEKKNTELSKIVNSKRFRTINKVANMTNTALPPGTIRRRALISPVRLSRYFLSAQEIQARQEKSEISKRRAKFAKEILRLSRNHSSVIVCPTMPWDHYLRQRPHHFAEQLSKLEHLFIYVDESLDKPRKISDNLLVVDGKWCIDAVSKNKRINKFFMLLSPYNIPFNELQAIISRGYKLIYDYIDEIHEDISGDQSNQQEIFERLEELNPVLLIAVAKILYSQLTERFPADRVLLCNNGVDVDHFKEDSHKTKKYAPKDLVPVLKLGKPIVGYYGAIANWIDYKLINNISRRRNDLSFVFIGVNYSDSLRQLNNKENVHYLGPKDYKQLPKYSTWFDCAIIPFKNGSIAKATSPLKLFEYMSMGVPTVCTRDLAECEGFDNVFVANTARDFENDIDKAIVLRTDKNATSRLVEQAREHTWRALSKKISDKLNETIEAEKNT